MSIGFSVFFIMLFFILLVVAVPVIIGVFVYRDAKARGMDPLLWTLLAVFAPGFIGLIIYLVIRREHVRLSCPKCGGEVQQSFVSCPACGQKLAASCGRCGMALRPEWKLCPQCGAEITGGGEFAPPVVEQTSNKGLLIAVIAILTVPVALIIVAAVSLFFFDFSADAEMQELYGFSCQMDVEPVYVTSSDAAELTLSQRDWIKEKQSGEKGIYSMTFSRPGIGEMTNEEGKGSARFTYDYTVIVVNAGDDRLYTENEISVDCADPFITESVSVTLGEAEEGDEDAARYGNVFVFRTISQYRVEFDYNRDGEPELFERQREDDARTLRITLKNAGDKTGASYEIPVRSGEEFFTPFK